MAKRGRRRVATQQIIDATPERLAKGDESEFVNPAEIDSKQTIALTRRFRSSHLDRLYRKDDPSSKLSWAQYYAGDWYRNLHARCHFALSVVASYGERTSAGEPSYGLARTEAQARARQQYREARQHWPEGMTGFMERLLIRNEYPRYGGRAAMRNLDQIRAALSAMARYLRLEV